MNNEYLELMRKNYNNIEIMHFNIIQRYVLGVISIEEINDFDTIIKIFREELDNFVTDDDTLLEIAAMKSQIQHFITDSIEDEEVLKVAYFNSNQLYIKVISE